MNKYLLFLPLLLLCSLTMYGQSVKFNDLVYFTSLSNREVYDNLKQGNMFRQDYMETVNGQELEYFKNIGAKPNTEKITVGAYTKLYDGTVLRTVNYNSTDVQNIINMISQAKRYGLDLKFRGADDANNIYLFDNNFYHVSIYLRRDQTAGLVEIKQKEYLGLE
ncbi:hypothetical protein [Mucilaginibacter sp.]|uniref:hypothetical protein n=1 Tax=Mucilaginibacter sp. TaxID=1882438 RepID=UPI003D0BFA4D